MRDLTDRQDEHFAIIARTDRAVEKLAIFVHGFRGNYWSTWGQLPHLLNTEADGRAVYGDWDYLFLGYDTGAIATYLDIAELIWTHWRQAEAGDPPYLHAYKKLALIGHSLGTLGIRQALCAHAKQPPGMLSALHGITLFGSPVNGSPLAKLAIFWEIRRALKPRSPQLRMLKAWTQDTHGHAPWPKVQIIAGTDDSVVGYEIAEYVNWTGDGLFASSNTNHGGLVKPKGWNTRMCDYLGACLK